MYGIDIVIGEFGAGKTFYTFLDAFYLKRKYGDDIIIIANAPYQFIDFFYSSVSDLKNIIKYLVEYIRYTNKKEYLVKSFKKIYLIVDEAHLYFPQTNFNFGGKLGYEELLVISQVRKRNIKISLITQELGQLNKRLRVLVPYVRKYYKGFRFYRRYIDYYLKKSDETDIKDPEIAQKIGGGVIFGGKLGPWYSGKKLEKWVSSFVVGSESYVNLDYLKKIHEKLLGNIRFEDFRRVNSLL